VDEAAMLATLLGSRAVDPRKEGNKPADLTRAIVAALAANGTPVAQGCLVGIVDGSLAVEDSQAAVAAALPALARVGRADTDDVVLRAILTPEELRPAGRGQVGAEELRKAALAAVRAGSSPRLRLRLAAAAVDPRQSGSMRRFLQGWLSEPAGENLDAMALLYGSSMLDASVRMAIETHLAGCGSQFVRGLLRIPEALGAPGARGAPGPAAGTTQPAAGVAELWNGSLTTAVNRRLELLESLPSEPGLIRLAATIPTDPVRPILYDALRRNWDDGADSLANTITPDMFWDPGLLVSMKLLRPRTIETADHVAKVKSHLTRRKPVRAMPQGVKDENRLRFDWLRLQYSLATSLCQRLNAAGQAQAGLVENSPGAGGDENLEAESPIPLHEGARVVSRFGVDWPKGLPDGVSEKDVAVTEVKYVRIQQTTTRLKAVVAHYRHQLDSPAEHPHQDGLTLWLDSLTRRADSGRCRSVDVIITRAKKAFQPNDPEDKISIDILLVEVNDPSRLQSKEQGGAALGSGSTRTLATAAPQSR
jgi:hypothetical protein